MKNRITILLAVLTVALALSWTTLATVNGPDTVKTAFSVASTNQVSTGASYAVVSARDGNGGTPAVTYAVAGTTSSNVFIQFYRVTAEATVMFTNSTVTLFVNNTNGFDTAQSGIVIVRHKLNDIYERRVLTANTDTTNLVLTVAPVQAAVPGDTIYRVTTAGAGGIFVGTAPVTNSFSASGGYMYVGQAGKPLLADISGNGTTTSSLYTLSGVYVPPIIVPRPGL